MQQFNLTAVLGILLLSMPAAAQSFDSLPQLKNHSFAVYYSAGHDQRAETIAQRVENAIDYDQQLLGFKPTVTLVVLSVADWNKYTAMPVVYGMPHYNEKNKRLIVAAEDNPFWKSFLPPIDQLPQEMRQPILSTYGAKDGQLSMQAFFDLLAIHELGHAFHMQAGLTMQRKWMGELFTNILLHTYIAEKEPQSLSALTLFPKMVIAGSTAEFKYTSLQDIHEHYNEVAQKYPKNYGWYQCRWHAASATIYDAGGKQVARKFWDALKSKKEILTDEQLIIFLETMADKSIAAMIKSWDAGIMK